jgi:hypothetical protein
MKLDNLLLAVAIIAVIISVVGAGITYSYINAFKNKLTGFATETATINLTVESAAVINFTTDNIDWGSGRVDNGEENATLNTAINNESNVSQGNWTGNTAGLVLENIGNRNVTLNLTAGVTGAAALLGGTGPEYEFNITNSDPNSCRNSSGGIEGAELGFLDIFETANNTQKEICRYFDFSDGSDTLRIDVKLVVPSDGRTGAISDIITATFEVSS